MVGKTVGMTTKTDSGEETIGKPLGQNKHVKKKTPQYYSG